MLYFIMSDGYEIPWHVGEPIPSLWQPLDPNAKRRIVIETYADGDELNFVVEKTSNTLLGRPEKTDRTYSWGFPASQRIYDILNGTYPPRS